MNTSNLQRAATTMYLALVTPGRRPHMPVWYGPPGGGKTEVQEAVAKAIGVKPEHNVHWIASKRSPQDLGGWPMPDPTTGRLRFEPPEDIHRVCEAPRAIVFLDELANADRTRQAGLQTFIRERQCGWRHIPAPRMWPTQAVEAQGEEPWSGWRGVMMMGATNEPDNSSDFQEQAQALANRITWIPFPRLSAEEHVLYEAAGEHAPEPFTFPTLTQEAWRMAFSRAISIYTLWMRTTPDSLWEDEKDEEVLGRWPLAYCTPRAWSAVVRYTATCVAVGDMIALQDLVVGTIGQAHGLEYMNLVRENDLLDNEDILKDPRIWKPDPARPDRTFAQMQGLALAACMNGRSEKEMFNRWHQAWRTLDITVKAGEGKDLCVPAAQHLANHKPPGGVLRDVHGIVQSLTPIVIAAEEVPA